MTFRELGMAVAKAAEIGWSLDRIDNEIIEPAALSRDEKDALWLIADHRVAHRIRGRVRYFARQAEAFGRARAASPVGTD